MWRMPRDNDGGDESHRAESKGMSKTASKTAKSRKGKKKRPPTGFGGRMPLSATRFQSASLQNCEITHLYCFKPPNLCSFVMAAL